MRERHRRNRWDRRFEIGGLGRARGHRRTRWRRWQLELKGGLGLGTRAPQGRRDRCDGRRGCVFELEGIVDGEPVPRQRQRRLGRFSLLELDLPEGSALGLWPRHGDVLLAQHRSALPAGVSRAFHHPERDQQIVPELAGVGLSVSRLEGQRALEHGLDLRRNVDVVVHRCRARDGIEGEVHHRRDVSVDDQPPSHGLDERQRQTPDVGRRPGLAELVRGPLLGRRVGRRERVHPAALRASGARDLAGDALRLRNAVVQELDDLLAARTGYEDVLGLDVLVHDAHALAVGGREVVGTGQRLRYGTEQAHQLLQRWRRQAVGRAMLDDRGERLTLEPLEHHVRHEGAFRGRQRVDMQGSHHRGDAGRELKEQRRFGLELRQELGLTLGADLAGELEAFERDLGAEAGVQRPIHDGKAAFGDHRLDLVGPRNGGANDSEAVLSHDRPTIARARPGTESGVSLGSARGYNDPGAGFPAPPRPRRRPPLRALGRRISGSNPARVAVLVGSGADL